MSEVNNQKNYKPSEPGSWEAWKNAYIYRYSSLGLSNLNYNSGVLSGKPFGFGRAIEIGKKQNNFLNVLRKNVLATRGQMASLEFCGGSKKDLSLDEVRNKSFFGFITKQGEPLWEAGDNKKFISVITNFENKFKDNFLDMVIRNPIAQMSMFYGRQEMNAMHYAFYTTWYRYEF